MPYFKGNISYFLSDLYITFEIRRSILYLYMNKNGRLHSNEKILYNSKTDKKVNFALSKLLDKWVLTKFRNAREYFFIFLILLFKHEIFIGNSSLILYCN